MEFGDYLFEEAGKLDTLRLLIEGAYAIYESDAEPLCGLAIKAQAWEALFAFEAVGTALTSMRDCLHELQDAHIKAAVKHIEA